MALWNFFDPKLIEIGAIPSLEVAKAAYDAEARAALVQLHEFPTGDTIEEDHRRGTQLIVNYIREKTGAIQPVERDGKVYMVVKDYDQMRKGVGMLLAELMRIKAEGDYDGGQGAHLANTGFTSTPRGATRWCSATRVSTCPPSGAASILTWCPATAASPTDIKIVYPRDIVKQQLRYTAITGH